MSSLVIGLTGGIGSGKTTIANMFEALGVELIDADIVARDVVAPNSNALNKIKQHFGEDFILPTGFLDRAKLRKKIFSSESDKEWLNNLLHPLIREAILEQIHTARTSYCILVAPLLLENGLNNQVNRVLVIDVPVEIQLERTLLRDDSNRKTIENIISSQVSRDKRLAAADDIIDNSTSDMDKIKAQVATLDKEYKSLFHAKLLK